MYLVQPVPHMWNVVITEVRHEEQNLPRRPRNDLMLTSEMGETSNSSSSPSRAITGTIDRSEALEHGLNLLT
jgi:hypothetical protein